MTKHEGGRYHDGERFLPWYTGPCLEWLITLDLKGKDVWEYGIGESTIWYRSVGAYCFGVDSDEKWMLKVGDKYDHEFKVWPGDYETSIAKRGYKYDIVVIDGMYRDSCTEYALFYLKPGGYLIIDNWEQSTVCPDWPLTKKFIEGMPIKLYYEPDHWDKWCTAVIQKPL